MRNILLLILIATIPLMSVAQKRSKKKNTNAKMGEMKKMLPSEFEYMVITGVQSLESDGERQMPAEELAARGASSGDIKMKGMISSNFKTFVRFDTGKITPEQVELNRMSRACNHMSDALYQASKIGWEFVSASHTSNDEFITHYYYMKRKRSLDK